MEQQIRFTEDLTKLEQMFREMSLFTIDNVKSAIEIVDTWDSSNMATILEKDKRVEILETEIHNASFKVLALYNPLASDLRYILAMLASVTHIRSICERSVKIAKRAHQLLEGDSPKEDLPYHFGAMSQKVLHLLEIALNTIPERKSNEEEITKNKEAVEGLHREHRRMKVEGINQDPSKAYALDKGWSISNHLRNMTDEIREIASEAVFIETGELPYK